jgi:hypothetical protein
MWRFLEGRQGFPNVSSTLFPFLNGLSTLRLSAKTKSIDTYKTWTWRLFVSDLDFASLKTKQMPIEREYIYIYIYIYI